MDDTRYPLSFTIPASELPESLIARFPERPPADARVVLSIESDDDDEILRALKTDIEQGLSDLDAGRVSDGAEVLARLEKRFPPV
jgi:hypothetical protein